MLEVSLVRHVLSTLALLGLLCVLALTIHCLLLWHPHALLISFIVLYFVCSVTSSHDLGKLPSPFLEADVG